MKRHKALRRHSEKGLAYLAELIEIRPQIEARAGYMCEARLDGCEYAIAHIHHKRRRSQGGKNTAENLLGVCMECHARIHANPDWSYKHGWLIRG